MVLDIKQVASFPNLKSVLYNNAITGSNKKIVPAIVFEPIYETVWPDCQADATVESFRLHIEYLWNRLISLFHRGLPAIGNIY
jgi:hypothetical protein